MSTVGAQDLKEVTVQAKRMLTTQIVGRTATGIPITQISMSYTVSLAGVDLSTQAGVQEIENRINDVALTACKDISSKYPTAEPSDAECAKIAAKKPLAQLHQMAKGSKAS
ncbi:MAG TPA: UrcA family protein [Steroidobacteraceae bacterium]|nr:UrcA family protein [Steroidobacteraceae bacterium]